ncbi:MAG: hypothetical protein GC190_21025 [Alphaproteobacteria bacterium]|nr:hypothetical protein [Alphaproteobacteria bacterium]
MGVKVYLLILGLTLANDAARAEQVLTISAACPNSGAYAGCSIVGVEDENLDLALNDRASEAMVSVHGRLNGGAERVFTLRVKLAADVPTIRAPYLGRSTANNPVFLTRGGALEVTDGTFDVSFSAEPGLIVIDEERREIVAQSYANEQVFLWHGRPELAQFDGRSCISRIQKVPGLLRADRQRCKVRPDYERPDGLTLEQLVAMVPLLRDFDLRELKPRSDELVFGGGGCYVSVSRLQRTHYLAANLLCEQE